MALTQVPIELSSTPGIVDNSNATAITIDSSENVGIGASPITLDGNATPGLTVSSNGPFILLQDANNSDKVRYISNNTGEFQFGIVGDNGTTGKTEHMRIDSSGNVLLGKTSSSFGTDGVEIKNDKIWSTNTSSDCISLNRKTSDGALATFYKDSSTIGSIGVASSNNLAIDGLVASHAGLEFGTGRITPRVAGATADNAVDLGYSTQRFQDLYLSGGAYLGGTGSVNHLDDYEEGTWTPVLVQTGNSVTHSAQTGLFVKVGRSVFISGFISWSAYTNGTGSIEIDGLPFNIANLTSAYSQIASFDHGGIPYTSGRTTFGFYAAVNTDKARLLVAGSGLNTAAVSSISSSGFIYFSGTFYTNS